MKNQKSCEKQVDLHNYSPHSEIIPNVTSATLKVYQPRKRTPYSKETKLVCGICARSRTHGLADKHREGGRASILVSRGQTLGFGHARLHPSYLVCILAVLASAPGTRLWWFKPGPFGLIIGPRLLAFSLV